MLNYHGNSDIPTTIGVYTAKRLHGFQPMKREIGGQPAAQYMGHAYRLSGRVWSLYSIGGYGEAEHRRALDMLWGDITGDRDADDAARVVSDRYSERERKTAPHGRCPHCMKPVTYEPAQHYTERCHGAPVAFEYRASYGCDECGIEIPEDQIVRVA